jgi:hypothetical protein
MCQAHEVSASVDVRSWGLGCTGVVTQLVTRGTEVSRCPVSRHRASLPTSGRPLDRRVMSQAPGVSDVVTSDLDRAATSLASLSPSHPISAVSPE